MAHLSSGAQYGHIGSVPVQVGAASSVGSSERPCDGDVLGAAAATVISAASKWAGKVFPRFCARRRMPFAARADSEYLAGTVCGGSRISVSEGSDDVHASASLRHSEET